MAFEPPNGQSADSRRPERELVELSLRVIQSSQPLLDRWSPGDLAAPYWRVYVNDREGARIVSGATPIDLVPGRMFVIPPETGFQAELRRPVRHFYMHFTISPSHRSRPGRIYSLPLDAPLRRVLDELLALDDRVAEQAVRAGVLSQWIATTALTIVPPEHFRPLPSDPRIRAALDTMQRIPVQVHSNGELAAAAHMDTNAFVRLFRQEVGQPPQTHQMQLRIDRACVLLHATGQSIESIAEALGFCDRYHFTRAFKRARGVGPATFRKLSPAVGPATGV